MTAEYITCSCCGRGIRDNCAENADHETRGCDVGFGHCRACFGDDKVVGTTKRATRKRLGWAGTAFFDTRIKLLTERLSPENAKKFRAMKYAEKVAVVTKMIEKGAMS